MEDKELNFEELLNPIEKYIIPIYQRNYAWGIEEITQFLQDILDMSHDDSRSAQNYYVGTLITGKSKVESSAPIFEVIDGQQRHTTITLINAVLKEKFKIGKWDVINLSFEAREEMATFLNKLMSDYVSAKAFKTDSVAIENVKRAVNLIERFLGGMDNDKLMTFCSYFYQKVRIIRIGVPEDTDINHYFEIMNNRGEQLEKHEILKAKFIAMLPADSREEFAEIWDACSQMDRPIQMTFSKDRRIKIFGEGFTIIPREQLRRAQDVNTGEANVEECHKLKNLLEVEPEESNSGSFGYDSEGKLRSVIDFSGFLLHVLKLQPGFGVISLDDKGLLKSFKYPNVIMDGRVFINELLRYRVLFDRYIIKRVEGGADWPWKLRKPRPDVNGEISFVGTFSGSVYDNNVAPKNVEFIMLQSMLHVSNPGNNYKRWLQSLLAYLGKVDGNIDPIDFFGEIKSFAFTEFRKISDLLNEGVFTPRYAFNFIDYLLWDVYHKGERVGKEIPVLREIRGIINNNVKYFLKFSFTQNNSVEHLHAQSLSSLLVPIDDDPDFCNERKVLDNFGNLCLISSSSNSKYNDYNFEAKKAQFTNRESIESLKQVLMFSYKSWNVQEIHSHSRDMQELIAFYELADLKNESVKENSCFVID